MNNGTTPLVVRGYSLSAGPSFYEFRPYRYGGSEPFVPPVVVAVVDRPCTVDDCAKAIHAKGMCKAHYTRQLKGIPLDQDNRRKPFDTTDCGTPRGWRRHEYHKVPLCGQCRDAKNDYGRALYARTVGAK